MRKILLAYLMVTVLFCSCSFVGGKRIKGDGNITTEERSVGQFSAVEQHGAYDVYLSTGDTYRVKIEGEENLLPYIETTVSGDKLDISTKRGYQLRPGRSVKIFITAPSFSVIRSSGSGNINSQSILSDSNKIAFEVSGSADITAEVDAPEVKAAITGSGNINLKGRSKKLDADVTGSGDIKALDLQTEEAHIDITGSGNANVFASVKLTVNVAGSGDVRYKGNAPEVSSTIHGSGSVKKVE